MDKGLLIAFEGVDKAGKGTQSRMLAEQLGATRIAFPRYDTLVGKVIRRHLAGEVALMTEEPMHGVEHITDDADPLMFQCLMLANKMHATAEILSLLEKGQHVVLDRWIDSAMAYGGADGLDVEWTETVHAPLPRADITVFLDVDPEVTRARGRAPGDDRTRDDRYESDLPRLKKVYANYKAMFNGPTRHHRERITIDGSLEADVIRQRLWGMLGHHRR